MLKFESMRHVRNIVLIAVALPLAIACKKEKVDETEPLVETASLRVDVLPMFGNDVLYLDSTYVTPEGYDVQFSELKFYMQDIKNGSTILTDAALFDYRERGTLLLQLGGSYTDFADLQGNIGVDSTLNHDDPSAFSNSSWLNISNANDMHWGWNPGYIFIKIEAKVDTIQDANALFDHNVVFHIGLDANLKTFSFSNCQWNDMGGGTHNLPLKLDMLQFLNGNANPLDLKTEYSSHSAAGQEVLTSKVALNFKNALSLY
jgi:hypothetical protein